MQPPVITYSLKTLCHIAKQARVPHRQLALLLGVSLKEFEQWVVTGAPPEYKSAIKDMSGTLSAMLDKNILPQSQNALAVKGLICLSQEGAADEGDRQ